MANAALPSEEDGGDWIAAMAAQIEIDEPDDEESEQAGWNDPFPPLYRAVVGPPGTVGEHGDNEGRVRALLAEGHEVDARTEQGSTGQPSLMLLLLRCGADPWARDKQGNSARDWARHKVRGHEEDVVLTMEAGPACFECIALLDRAVTAWSPRNHETFPDVQRQLAVELLWIGQALSRRPARQNEGVEAEVPLGAAFLDVWEAHVMPRAVVRPTATRDHLEVRLLSSPAWPWTCSVSVSIE